MTGKVKWFDEGKGDGFITPENGERDVFVHFNAIEEEGYRALKEGQQVEFEIVSDRHGLRANNVRVIEDSHCSHCSNKIQGD